MDAERNALQCVRYIKVNLNVVEMSKAVADECSHIMSARNKFLRVLTKQFLGIFSIRVTFLDRLLQT